MAIQLSDNEQRVELQCLNPKAKQFLRMSKEEDAQFDLPDAVYSVEDGSTNPKETFTKVHIKFRGSAVTDGSNELLQWTVCKAYLVYPKAGIAAAQSETTEPVPAEAAETKATESVQQDFDSEPPSYNECCGLAPPAEYMLPPYSQTNDNSADGDGATGISPEPPETIDCDAEDCETESDSGDSVHYCWGTQDHDLARTLEKTDVLKRLYLGHVPSVVDDDNPTEVLSNILAMPDFDPHIPPPQDCVPHRKIVTLRQLSYRNKFNEIMVEVEKQQLEECCKFIVNGSVSVDEHYKDFYDTLHSVIVDHEPNEFMTMCQCSECLQYRDAIEKKVATQLNESKMMLAFLKVFTDFYGSMLKTSIAYNTFQNIVSKNRAIYWITSGLIYTHNASYSNCFKILTDNMILVLFSSILMVTNPLLLLQILAFRVEAIVRAYAEGFFESLDNPDKQGELEAEIMLDYIVHGYEEICRISEQVGSLLFAFENTFLQKFMLSWQLLCKRLYQQHVYLKLTDEMLTCILTLKEQPITDERAALIKRYILFDEQMEIIEKHWPYIWMEFNKFINSDLEASRRANMLIAYTDFKNVVEDSVYMSFDDLLAFYEAEDENMQRVHSQPDKTLVWKNYVYLLANNWKIHHYQPPNTRIRDDLCIKCKESLNYHGEKCPCITCMIAGQPVPPKNYIKGICDVCVMRAKEKDAALYESKILNICTSDDQAIRTAAAVSGAAIVAGSSSNAPTALSHRTLMAKRKFATLRAIEKDIQSNPNPGSGDYHIAWAVFKHLTERKPYKYETINEKHFCSKCELTPCLLARKILNNQMESTTSKHLIKCYQPLDISVAELCVIVPNLRLFNRNVVAFNIISKMHKTTVKVFWVFVISLFAEHFIDLKTQNAERDQLANLQLLNGDISLNLQKITGNPSDTKFYEFLEFIRGHPGSESCDKDFLMQHVNKDRRTIVETDHNYYKPESFSQKFQQQSQTTPPQRRTVPQPQQPQHQQLQKHIQAAVRRPDLRAEAQAGSISSASSSSASTSQAAAAVDTQPKKGAKPKKCCYDHPELAEHCKDAHCGKKRVKKDCGHSRVNETRDRLRKKLSQMANARKTQETQDDTLAAPIAVAAVVDSPQAVRQKSAEIAASMLATATPPPPVAKAKSAHAVTKEQPKKQEDTNNQPHTLKKSASAAYAALLQQPPPSEETEQLSPVVTTGVPCQKLYNSPASTPAESDASTTTNTPHNESESPKDDNGKPEEENITELMQNVLESFGKLKTNHKKWIDEKLSFIEGTDSSGKKQQPQSTNAKKAAKKAKQKQRKEEEKRIEELHEYRKDYQTIYFKEFVAKHHLKAMKANKKRDKKKVSELESSIKSLQRSKAEVEMTILELIATVKQTNNEFKFSYLPTKEQQIEKLREIEEEEDKNDNGGQSSMASAGGNRRSNSSQSKKNAVSSEQSKERKGSASTGEAQHQTAITNEQVEINNLNVPPAAYAAMPPYATNSTPGSSPAYAYPMEFHAQPHMAYGIMQPRIMPQVTSYAPAAAAVAQPQFITTSTTNDSTDPSKRIVTIRRVNMPNVSEPQVTVTAKGPSPDKDKLLYTFVNGHMVPMGTASATAACGSNGNMAVYEMPQMPIAGFVPIPMMATADGSYVPMQPAEYNSAGLTMQPLPANANAVDSSAKKQKKNKKNKKAAALSDVMKDTAVESSTTSSSITTSCSETHTRENSVSSQPAKPANADMQAESKKTKKQLSAEAKKQVHQKQKEAQQQQNGKEQQSKQNKESKSKSKKETTTTTPLPRSSSSSNSKSAATETKTQSTQVNCLQKTKRDKVVDNGQFDNNPYKSLHLNDSESEDQELLSRPSSPECEQEEVLTVRHAAKPNQAQAKVANKTPNQTSAASAQEPNQSTIKTDKRVGKKELVVSSTNSGTSKRNTGAKLQTAIQTTPTNRQKSATSNGNGGRTTTQQTKAVASREIEPPPFFADNAVKRNKATNAQQISRQQQEAQSSRSAQGANDRNRSKKLQQQPQLQPQQTQSSRDARNYSSRNGGKQPHYDDQQEPMTQTKRSRGGKEVKRKQLLKQQQQQQENYNQYGYESTGIPQNMGYYHAKDGVAIRGRDQQQQCTQYSTENLTQDLQAMHLAQQNSKSYADALSDQQHYYQPNYSLKQSQTVSNISIMDQLNRGVQVENLSLPPGITLTKVDPAKSEQLRQKSESIKQLSKPLAQQQPTTPQIYHQHPSGATIIAPPVGANLTHYYGTPATVPPYSAIAAAHQQKTGGNIIMVEANPTPKVISQEAKAIAAGIKPSKNKKRRGGKASKQPKIEQKHVENSEPIATTIVQPQQPQMITLRNPMFHNPAAASILQQPPTQLAPTARPLLNQGMPMAAGAGAHSLDQPAAIIKNENGMYTIRNPALHQAVTNGLVASGFRGQLNSVNYYTPQEAAAEATKANQEIAAKATAAAAATAAQSSSRAQINVPATPFSYFSSSSEHSSQIEQESGGGDGLSTSTATASNVNNISISCTSVNTDNGMFGIGDVPVAPKPKYLSAIGSEIKSAQQNRQKTQETPWTNFGESRAPCSAIFGNANISSSPSSNSTGGVNCEFPNVTSLQDQYQHSTYYNGFDVFKSATPTASQATNPIAAAMSSSVQATVRSNNGGSSLFDNIDCHHMHHSCGDDSPPPSITGFTSSYLDGIPNTGVIRYDDAAFLKSLIPGQQLNNEVSIHNVNDSNFARNTSSPVPHRVDITPIFAQSSPTGSSQTTSSVFRDSLSDFVNDSQLFSHKTTENFSPYGFDFERQTSLNNAQNASGGGGNDFSDLLSAQRKSPYLKETTHAAGSTALDTFVQNMNALKIATLATDEELGSTTTNLNGNGSTGSTANSHNNNNNQTTNATNGWW